MWRWILCRLATIWLLVESGACQYREKLVLQPLPRSALLAAFNFQSNTTLADFEQQNYNLFPRSLGQILLHTHAEELHLRFALGRWDGQNWGARPRGGRREGGTGVELWAWVRAGSDEQANARWSALTNALSGLFCASLNFVDQTKTIRPAASFDREGNRPVGKLHLLHGTLPHEVVCTENLTPFLKLLPCKGKAGISSLLDGHKLFDASWQTMALDVRSNCFGSGACQVEIEQTVDMVLDIERSMRPADDPIPRPPPIEKISCNTTKAYNAEDTCYPDDQTEEPAWSLKEIFGRPIRGSCPLNQASAIDGDLDLVVPHARKVSADVFGREIAAKASTSTARSFQLPEGAEFDLRVASYPMGKDVLLETPLLSADRTFSGYGQERGGVHTVLTNLDPKRDLDIVYLESLPWFMKLYLHTLKATVTASGSSTKSAPTKAIRNILYRPAVDRQRGTHLEVTLSIPAASTLTLTYYFEKAILRYTEYPPDANRGFDVAPAVIRILPFASPPNSSSSWSSTSSPPSFFGNDSGDGGGGAGPSHSTYMRTTSLLLPLPTPDFSMPYNVIILTSTVIAMGFGSIFNLITRRFVAADEVDGGVVVVGVADLKARLAGLARTLAERVRQRRRRLAAGAAAGPAVAADEGSGAGESADVR